MKCPKCGYLGFDRVERCRNCGYEFSLARPAESDPELPLRTASDTTVFADLSIVAPPREPRPADVDADLEAVLAAPAAATSTERPRTPRPSTSGELPLFGAGDDAPLITKRSSPRPPLAVRRATPETPRMREETLRAPMLDLPLDLDAAPAVVSPDRAAVPAWRGRTEESGDTAGIGSRILAALIDLAVLAVIDFTVVYFTIQICGLTPGEFDILPKVPLLAFLLVQNGGYFIAFTAGGQTLGKMAAGIKVVAAGSGSTLDVGRATLRTIAWVLLAIPAGLGFLPALFSSDHRGLHDRFAGTRVVRASA